MRAKKQVDGDEEYYDDYGEDDQQFDPSILAQMMGGDQATIAQMLSGLAQNPYAQQTLDPNQLSMLMDPS